MYMSFKKSPPREEGWTRHQENFAKPPFKERTGWSLTTKQSRVSDHPVCSFGAAVPSSRGGDYPSQSQIRLTSQAGASFNPMPKYFWNRRIPAPSALLMDQRRSHSDSYSTFISS